MEFPSFEYEDKTQCPTKNHKKEQIDNIQHSSNNISVDSEDQAKRYTDADANARIHSIQTLPPPPETNPRQIDLVSDELESQRSDSTFLINKKNDLEACSPEDIYYTVNTKDEVENATLNNQPVLKNQELQQLATVQKYTLIVLLFMILLIFYTGNSILPLTTHQIKTKFNIDDLSMGIMGASIYAGDVLGFIAVAIIFEMTKFKVFVVISLIMNAVSLYGLSETDNFVVFCVSRFFIGFTQTIVGSFIPNWIHSRMEKYSSRFLWAWLMLAPCCEGPAYVIAGFIELYEVPFSVCFEFQMLLIACLTFMIICLFPREIFFIAASTPKNCFVTMTVNTIRENDLPPMNRGGDEAFIDDATLENTTRVNEMQSEYVPHSIITRKFWYYFKLLFDDSFVFSPVLCTILMYFILHSYRFWGFSYIRENSDLNYNQSLFLLGNINMYGWLFGCIIGFAKTSDYDGGSFAKYYLKKLGHCRRLATITFFSVFFMMLSDNGVMTAIALTIGLISCIALLIVFTMLIYISFSPKLIYFGMPLIPILTYLFGSIPGIILYPLCRDLFTTDLFVNGGLMLPYFAIAIVVGIINSMHDSIRSVLIQQITESALDADLPTAYLH